jgi:integrase
VKEFLAHLASCPGAKRTRVSLPLQLVAVTGLRLAEACGLAWNDLDLVQRTLTVEYTLQAAGSELFVKGPKSARGYRTIGLPTGLVESLGAHRAHSNQERLRAGTKYQAKPLGRDFVFRGEAFGSPLTPGRLSDGMRREWDHAALTPRTTLHGLRHAVASVLILNGLTVTDVAAHLGDEPNTITLFYQHELNGERRRDTVNKVIGELYG